jgi:hypothetical protein
MFRRFQRLTFAMARTSAPSCVAFDTASSASIAPSTAGGVPGSGGVPLGHGAGKLVLDVARPRTACAGGPSVRPRTRVARAKRQTCITRRIARTVPPPHTLRLRAGVGAAVRHAGLPYGYTLTVWSTAQATIAAHGTPAVGLIALFAVGAVTAYRLLRAATSGVATDEKGPPPGSHPGLRGWLIQAAAVAGPVALMAVAAPLLPVGVCWPLAGIATVLGYIGVMGLGHTLADDE